MIAFEDFLVAEEDMHMVKAYCYSKCTTCKKALKWLGENKIEHTVINIKGDHPNEKRARMKCLESLHRTGCW